MTETGHGLAALRRRLAGTFAGGAGPEVRLLPGNQMLVVRGLVPNPAAGGGGKAESYIPGPDGYKVYVASLSPEEHAAVSATSQRILGPAAQPQDWDPRSMALRLPASATGAQWRVLSRRGRVVTVHARCGSRHVVTEVDRILAEIEAVLLS